MSGIQVKLENKTALLGVIGLGYVGLPLAVEKAKAGFLTFGFDPDISKIELIKRGESYISDVNPNELKDIVKRKKLNVTSDYSKIKDLDCISICVPTPLDNHQQPDLSYLISAASNILPHMHSDLLIVLESTTYPGTTREIILPILEKSGLVCGKDFYLAFSPERVDPGNTFFKTKNTPKVVGGISEKCTKLSALMYEKILEAPIIKVSSPEVAEMEKILENTYRNINIGLINEFAIISHKMGIDIWEVIDAAKTKPYGFQAFYPGPGIGGHCIPLDPYYLSWKAREFNHHTSMIEASMVINDGMPDYVVNRAVKILNKHEKSIKNANILLIGVAYKRDIPDYRESPALKIIEKLEILESNLDYYDPYVKEINVFKSHKYSLGNVSKKTIINYDLIVVVTDHSNIDYESIVDTGIPILDTRNKLKEFKNYENIETL